MPKTNVVELGKEPQFLVWNYPDIYDPYSTIEIHISHVRASDGIRIKYDAGRDGWVIEQPTILSWNINDSICDPKWKEAAFIPSWQFSEEKELLNG